MILGKDLVLKLNGTAIGAAKDCSVKVSQQFIDSCAPNAGRVMTKIPSTYAWEMSCSCLCVSMDQASSFVLSAVNGTTYTARFRDSEMGVDLTGTVYIQDVAITGKHGSLVTLEVQFVGSGALTEVAGTAVDLTTYNDSIAERDIDCDGTTVIIYELDDTHHCYFKRITVESGKVSRLVITSASAYGCIFLHKGTTSYVKGLVDSLVGVEHENEFIDTANGYLGHVHGSNNTQTFILGTGTYVLTWDTLTGVTATIKES